MYRGTLAVGAVGAGGSSVDSGARPRASSPLPASRGPDRLPPRTPAGEARSFSALSSGVRVQVLRALATRAKTVAELSKQLGVHAVTLRYHLGLLMAQGLVESSVASGTRKKGRPATLYRLSNRAVVPGFPERHFDLLARISLATLVDTVGEDAASVRLRGRGSLVGQFLIKEAAARAHIDRWTPEAFERVVLNGLFPDFGIACEVVSRDPDRLTYRSFTCPFLEIATEVPVLVCDALDDGFHEGLDEALGGARTERVACMGHGDPHCQYVVRWSSVAPTKPARPRPRSSHSSVRPSERSPSRRRAASNGQSRRPSPRGDRGGKEMP